MTGIPDTHPDGTALPDYVGQVASRRFKRIKLGLFLSSLAACLGVTLLGAIGSGFVALATGIAGISTYSLDGQQSFAGGLLLGLQLATYNFFLFFITVPAAWLALGLSIGRLPYRGIVKRVPFVRWGAIWGSILVGGTTGIFGGLIGSASAGDFSVSAILYIVGSLVSGILIGFVAGALCGLLFHTIVKPAQQLADVDVNVF